LARRTSGQKMTQQQGTANGGGDQINSTTKYQKYGIRIYSGAVWLTRLAGKLEILRFA
jgi:hypothetical protein